jgi:signal transduction histidine kinase/CheY-like chemotaxis protein
MMTGPRVIESFRRNFWFEGVDDAALDVQAETIRKSFAVAFSAALIGAWLLIGAQWMLIKDQGFILWATAYTLFSLLAVVYNSRYKNPSPQKKIKMVALWFGGAGLLWGILAAVIMRHHHAQAVLLYSAFITTTTGGALVVATPYLPAFLGFMVPPAISFFISINYFVANGTHVFSTRGVGVMIYMVAVWYFAVRMNKTNTEGILLRFENTKLLADLKEQTIVAESARIKAEDSDRAKSKFLAAASHDLRQPIHAISLFLEAMDRSNLSEAQLNIIADAMSATRSCQDLLKTLLDFSRIEAGVVQAQPISFPLQPLLYQLYNQFGNQADNAGLIFRLRDTALWVDADPLLCELILRNLLANAIRYTAQGGVLIGVRHKRRSGIAVIEIWDTGIGIAKREREKIFRDFYQVDNPERNREKGLGLGLSIVGGLCRTMGVEVSLASKEGGGSVFRLHLPMAQTQHEMAPNTLHEAPYDQCKILSKVVEKLQVLVIDDNQAVLNSMCQLLMNNSISCKAAGSIEEAQNLLCDWQPNLLISDYRLRNHETGGDAIHRLRERLGQETPAIIVTGDTSPERLRDASSLKAVLLHKPLRAEQLFDAIGQVYCNE